jgi:hypothetical protein
MPGTAKPRAASSGRSWWTARVMVERSTPVQHRQGLVRQLEAQVDQGGQDPIGEDQLVVGAGAGGAAAWMAAALLEAPWWAAVHGPANSAVRSPRCCRDSPVRTG